MANHGTIDEGFATTFDPATRSVRVRVWGFWRAAIADDFVVKVLAACDDHSPTQLVVEATDLKPQRDEGQAAFGRLFAALPALGLKRAAIVTGNALTKLQLLRIAKEHPVKGLLEFTTKLEKMA